MDDASQQRGTFYHTQMTSMALGDSGNIKAHLNVGSGSIKTATMNPENSETRKDHLRILGNISEDVGAKRPARAEDDAEGDYADDRFEEEDAAGKLSSVRVGSGLESGPAASSQPAGANGAEKDSDQDVTYQDDVFEKSDDGAHQD